MRARGGDRDEVSGVDTSTGVAVTSSVLGFLPSAPRPLHPNAKSLPSLANASVCWLPTATSSTTTSVKILTGLIVASKFPVPVCPHVFAPTRTPLVLRDHHRVVESGGYLFHRACERAM